MLKTAFGWGESEMWVNVKKMLNRGENGLDGFIHFFKYFVLQRGLEGAMIEPKIDRLLCIPVEFPQGRNHHISFPFGIHNERDIPWDYRSTGDKFYIQAKLCHKPSVSEGSACDNCQALTSIPLYIIGGLVEVARRKTEQVQELRLMKLNASRRLLGKATALDDHKQWVMVIASGKVGLKCSAGIKTLIHQYERAAEKLYRPMGYSNEDLMRSIVMLRLGGARVAEFTHRSLSLLSISTIRCNTVLQPLTVSPAVPTLVEIEQNISLCHSGLAGMDSSDNRLSNHLDSHQDSRTRPEGLLGGRVHQVLMLDELAIEQRVRWDDSTNKFLGICREHSHQIPLEFTSERELDLLCDTIGEKKVHLVSEATVAGIGPLSAIPREYSVQLIMFAGTCKRENGPHHNLPYRTVCIASDGEAKRGDALLSTGSPIYGQLSSLKFMNHLVGPDDITTDKDFKHILKRQRNLFMRHKGVLIQGFCVTPTILRAHLKSHGVPSHRLQSLLNPNDKQDVVLAFYLLKEICSLPPPPDDSDPLFACAREALNVYGQFTHHLMMPYQLIHLSAAAHMAFFLYRDGCSRTQFMPTQLRSTIRMVTPMILLGTDRLETFFGLIRTAVGTDANVDILQLGSQASGLTEHPEWDLGPHHNQDREITSKFDHITPKDWHGNASVTRKAVTCIPEAGNDTSSNIDMLSPLEYNGEDQGKDNIPNNSFSEGPGIHFSNAVQEADSSCTPLSHTHDGDVEDAIADEMPRNNTSKAKALCYRMAFRGTQLSTDRLKRVQNIPCFGSTTSPSDPNFSSDSFPPCDDISLWSTLCIGNPVAILVRCDGLVVLAIAQINRLRFASHSNLDELAVHLLVDPMAKADCQLLRLLPATIEDDPTCATCEGIDGRYIHLLNPAISVLRPGRPTFLFEGSFLVTLSCSMFQDLWQEDYRVLPVVRHTEFFPYRFEGMWDQVFPL
ncbi:hypothetical protein EI94DRAFT_1774312 [Lactarius quietus]|nr:hypothetical protein EI94DRAFT_1774312 [Lactarius quietus]